MSVRVLVVDDQRIVREGLALLLRTTAGVELVGAAENGRQALDLVAELAPDVVLMDLRMPELDGVEATRAIRAAHPAVQVIVLTTYSDDESVFAALRAGARGYLTKDAEADELCLTVENLLADARGASPDAELSRSGGGYGLTGMAERARLLGGDLVAGPTPTGFRVVLRLPVPSPSATAADVTSVPAREGAR